MKPISSYLIKFLLLLAVLSQIACTSKPQMEGFSEERWKADNFGCKGQRKEQADILLQKRKELQGVSERQINELLGRPDRQAIYERGIRNLIYFVEPGGQCQDGEGKNGRRIIIELNALGNITWINEETI